MEVGLFDEDDPDLPRVRPRDNLGNMPTEVHYALALATSVRAASVP